MMVSFLEFDPHGMRGFVGSDRQSGEARGSRLARSATALAARSCTRRGEAEGAEASGLEAVARSGLIPTLFEAAPCGSQKGTVFVGNVSAVGRTNGVTHACLASAERSLPGLNPGIRTTRFRQ